MKVTLNIDIGEKRMDNLKIQTEVSKQYKQFKSEHDFDKEIREKIAYILDNTRDKHYKYKSLMIWVAQETRSVVYIDESTLEVIFTYVGG